MAPAAAELVFVEAGSGLVQVVPLGPGDDRLFEAQLERLVEFLEHRRRARERLRHLRFRPAFAAPRPGQETTRAELTALFSTRPLVLLEAPTGFGKTGVLLEFALDQLRSRHFDRALYLTGKSTGQLQVLRTLAEMTADGAAGGTPVAAWQVRNKAEHCVNATFHCLRETCGYLDGAAARWPASGLARFYLDEHHARDLPALRDAGRDARICPYEITRAALAFHDLWIGDYNYVFAPRNRTLFQEQPGFDPARTLLIVDEAHNLPARVADAHSHAFTAAAAFGVREDLHRVRAGAGLTGAWEHWCHFLHALRANAGLTAGDEDDARHLLGEIARHLGSAGVDFAALGPQTADALWSVPALLEEIGRGGGEGALPRLWWSPRDSELSLTCLDAGRAIGGILRGFGGVVLASATLSPVDGFAAACGLDAPPEAVVAPPATAAPERLGALNKRETRKLFRQLTSAADLLRVEESRTAASPALLPARAPWREAAYDVAFDSRVDTRFQQRALHHGTTAATLAALRTAAGGAVAVFLPSYAYAEAIQREAQAAAPDLRVAIQPRARDLAAQTAWVEESLRGADALLLVLGSSFAEGIDSLGGRVTHAMVVGPALPEVNPVQEARLADAMATGLSREAAFRRVYRIPGMTKVNQALGRLVRAPGQRARVLLHCRRFLEPEYRGLLAPEYQAGPAIADDAGLGSWLRAR
jgi:Rad3-related DNA helicase